MLREEEAEEEESSPQPEDGENDEDIEKSDGITGGEKQEERIRDFVHLLITENSHVPKSWIDMIMPSRQELQVWREKDIAAARTVRRNT